MNPEQIRARLKEIAAEIETLLKDAKSDEDYAKLKTLSDESTGLEAKLTQAELSKQTLARLSGIPAVSPAAQKLTVPAVSGLDKLTPLDKMGLIAVAAIHSNLSLKSGMPKGIVQFLTEKGFGIVGDEYQAAYDGGTLRTLNSASATAGGILLPDSMSTEMLPLLRPLVTFFQGNPRRVQMPSGVFKQPAADTGATASYRGETKPIQVSEPSFKGINMSAKLLGVIVMLSDQILRWDVTGIRQWVMEDMASAMAQATDNAMYFGDGTVYTPQGILEIPGIYRVTAPDAVDPVAPTVREIEQAAGRLELNRENNNLPIKNTAWRTSPRIFKYLQDLRGNFDQKMFPEMSNATPTFRGRPILATSNFPSNAGGTTDESTLALIDFGYVLYGESLAMQFATSNEASIQVTPSKRVDTFQSGVVAIKVEAEHDVDVQYVEAIGVMDGLRWGSTA